MLFNNKALSRFDRWMLKRIAKRACKQGNQFDGLELTYKIIHDEAKAEFTEDNIPTLHAFLKERFNRALDLRWKH